MKKAILVGMLFLIFFNIKAQYNKINEKVYKAISYREYDTDFELTRRNVLILVKWDSALGRKDEVGKILQFKTPKNIYKVLSPYQFRRLNEKGNEEWEGKVKDQKGRQWDSDLIVYKDSNFIIFLVYETADKYYTITIDLSDFK